MVLFANIIRKISMVIIEKIIANNDDDMMRNSNKLFERKKKYYQVEIRWSIYVSISVSRSIWHANFVFSDSTNDRKTQY